MGEGGNRLRLDTKNRAKVREKKANERSAEVTHGDDARDRGDIDYGYC